MSKEVMQQALEALEANQPVNYCMNNNGEKFPMMQEDPFKFERNSKAITALREALAEQPAQQCNHCNGSGRMVRDQDIGTDQECFVCDGKGTVAPEQPAHQEPVAVVSGYYGGQCVILPIDPARIYNSNTFLYTSPQPCPTCEALARTVMLDQTSHDAQRKPTDEMVVAAARMLSDRQAAACNVDCGDMWKLHGNDFIEDARAALEAAHGIGEKK